MNAHRHYFIAILLVILGALIYILFREPVIFTLPFMGGNDTQPVISLPDNVWSYTLRYLLPDALWCTALLTYASTIQSRVVKWIALVIPTVMELAQLSPGVYGTFDIVDLTIYIILTIIFLLKWKKSKFRC